MPVLHDVFPDAKVVRLHRHPCQRSPRSPVSIYRRLTTRQIDGKEIGATCSTCSSTAWTSARAADGRRARHRHQLSRADRRPGWSDALQALAR
jgi:hypothetical protein